jgi:predicted HTH transcriptional regulator
VLRQGILLNTAQELFQKLVSFKHPGGSVKTPSQLFLEYCTQVLGAVEGLHMDFKQKHDSRRPELDDDDKKNLAKAVSGFANSGGGVLIWGIEDKTLSPRPITDIQTFVSSVLALAAQATDPTVLNIDSAWIATDPETSGNGFGLILIPESTLPPHRVILKLESIKNHYFIRSGDSFVVASHTMLVVRLKSLLT